MKKDTKKIVWTSENEKDFYPSRPSYLNVPNGIYSLKYSVEYGPYLSTLNFKTDKSMSILNSYFEDINSDFKSFLSLKDKYKNSEIEFNRAVLVHGQPGCGKKYLCRRLAESFEGITIYAEDPTDLNEIISSIQEGNKNVNILVILEEIGIILEKYGLFPIKNLLKSNENVDGVYMLATTNFEEKIAEFLTDKPGMFEEKFFIEYPDEVERGQYIKILSDKLELKFPKNKISKISKDTDGMSIGNIKNLIESTELYGYNYSDKLEELNEMQENIIASNYSEGSSRIGFE
jgi:SpoVK/Ycf46/Vps4 family AAA+-type ATPase